MERTCRRRAPREQGCFKAVNSDSVAGLRCLVITWGAPSVSLPARRKNSKKTNIARESDMELQLLRDAEGELSVRERIQEAVRGMDERERLRTVTKLVEL